MQLLWLQNLWVQLQLTSGMQRFWVQNHRLFWAQLLDAAVLDAASSAFLEAASLAPAVVVAASSSWLGAACMDAAFRGAAAWVAEPVRGEGWG